MPVVHRSDHRRTVTPNATMTTHASPTQGGAGLAVWTVEMAPGAVGPLHSFDAEQVWTVLDGSAGVELADERHELTAGDTVVMPAGALRRVHAGEGFRAVVAAPAGARATAGDADPVLPPWIA